MAASNPPKDKADRVRRAAPARGEWRAAPGVGWQHGPIPAAPPKVLKATRDVWETWFKAWFASHWQPEDLPGLLLVGKLYDEVMRGALQRSAELRIQMDAYGMTPKGQQDRRWKRPEAVKADDSGSKAAERPAGGRYGHLRSVKGTES